MKKTLSVIILLTAFLCSYNQAKAFKVLKESKNPEITVESSSNPQQVAAVAEETNNETILADFPDIKVTKNNDKFFIFNKKSNSYTFSSDFEIVKVEKFKNVSGYKLVAKNAAGYINEDGSLKFFVNEIIPVGNYLKIKKDNLYGICDNSGRIIIPAVNEKVNLVHTDSKEYFAVKNNGKYKLYSNAGELIPENELYSVVTNDSVSAEKDILARDIRPELLGGKRFSLIVYENSNLQKNDTEDNDLYEIKDIKIPGYEPKTSETAIKTVSDKVAAAENDASVKPLSIGKYEFYPKEDSLLNSKGDVILPFAAETLSFFQPKKLFKTPMLIASKNNIYYVYDMKGNLIAEQTFEKINVYQYGRVYTYTPNGNAGELTCSNKLIGTISKTEEGFEFNQKAFTILNINKVTDILFAVLKEMENNLN